MIKTDKSIFTSISRSISTSTSESTSEDDTRIVEYKSSIHIIRNANDLAIIQKNAVKPDGVPSRPLSDKELKEKDEKLKEILKDFVKSRIEYIKDGSNLFNKIKEICTNLGCKMENCPHVAPEEAPCVNLEPNVIRCTVKSNIVKNDLDTKYALNFIYGLPTTYNWTFTYNNDNTTTCKATLNQKIYYAIEFTQKSFRNC